MRIINTADILETTALDHNAREFMYNGLDCCVTLEIRDALLPLLDNVTAGTYEFAKALQAPVLAMTTNGVLIDDERRQLVLSKYQGDIARLSRQLTSIVGEGIG